MPRLINAGSLWNEAHTNNDISLTGEMLGNITFILIVKSCNNLIPHNINI